MTMKVSVLTILGSQQSLVASAKAGIGAEAELQQTKLPPDFEIDASFPAVPLGSGGRDTRLSQLQPDQSAQFAVRGFIETNDPSQIPVSLGDVPLFADPAIAPFITCGGTPPLGNTADVQAKLAVSRLAERGLDGSEVAVAIMDTGINLQHLRGKLGRMPRFDAANSWQPPGGTGAPGHHPVDHGTMCAYDALIAAPNATLMDYPILSSTAPGGSISGATLAMAFQGLAQLITVWAVAFAAGGAARYKALVINNSWGIFHPSWDFPAGHPGRYIDNPNHPFNGLVSVMARAGGDIVFAAGNCGRECPDGRCQTRTSDAIMGANASADVLTLAGCDIQDARVGYSSQGPSIAGMYPQKPDLTCYTHFLGSEAFGAGTPDSGTSAACPVAAGCIAALRTRLSPAHVPPANLFAQLRASARHVRGNQGWNGDYGHGILDPEAAAQIAGL
ncbi:S8 family serine peptidase [Rhodopseudomonas sp.]|uniref:S8 family serine peptidase n=1 Tax=Rhodopseudomonas sp. TaxID=1078 RepID=UPI003B3A328E